MTSHNSPNDVTHFVIQNDRSMHSINKSCCWSFFHSLHGIWITDETLLCHFVCWHYLHRTLSILSSVRIVIRLTWLLCNWLRLKYEFFLFPMCMSALLIICVCIRCVKVLSSPIWQYAFFSVESLRSYWSTRVYWYDINWQENTHLKEKLILIIISS